MKEGGRSQSETVRAACVQYARAGGILRKCRAGTRNNAMSEISFALCNQLLREAVLPNRSAFCFASTVRCLHVGSQIARFYLELSFDDILPRFFELSLEARDLFYGCC